MSSVKIESRNFEIIDALEYITLADSFVKKTKIGTGHGEAKLYVGNESQRLFDFFGDFSSECFFLKKDFVTFLDDAKSEYLNPQQNYVHKDEMESIFQENVETVKSYKKSVLSFQIYRVGVEPPRVYVNSNSEYYGMMRNVALPNISYLSVLKLKDEFEKISYYFRIFIDYKSDFSQYTMPEEQRQLDDIASSITSEKKKQSLVQSRVGQGEYRNKLLEECPYCPFTMVNDERLLIASHIKPWVDSNNDEKVDPKNGFMLTPTYDKLFDRGFITFNDDKTLEVSPWLSPMNQKRLNIYTGKIISGLPLDDKRIAYLKYHREHIFKH